MNLRRTNNMKQYMEQGTPSSGYYEKYETSTETMPAQWVLVLVSGVLAGLALLLALLYWWQFGQTDSPSLAPAGSIGRSVIAEAGWRQSMDCGQLSAIAAVEATLSKS
jgi:hypothetical protein